VLYLLICNHFKQLVNADSPLQATHLVKCPQCNDVRVYVPTEAEVRMVAKYCPRRPRKREKLPQMDWIKDLK
jgi:phage FluMu protein Com